MSKVYVYKEYCDGDAYGEELVEVYADCVKARAKLLSRVADFYGYDASEYGTLDIGNLKRFLSCEGIIDNGDEVGEEYVSIMSNKGVCYWIVEKKELLGLMA